MRRHVAPWTYLIIHGLQRYGFHAEAREIAAKWLAAASNPAGLYEWYNAETGRGEGSNPFGPAARFSVFSRPPSFATASTRLPSSTLGQRLNLQDVRSDLSLPM